MNLYKRRCWCPCEPEPDAFRVYKSPKLLLKNATDVFTMMRFQLRRRSRVMLLDREHTGAVPRSAQGVCPEALFCRHPRRRPCHAWCLGARKTHRSNWTRQEIALHFTKGSISVSSNLRVHGWVSVSVHVYDVIGPKRLHFPALRSSGHREPAGVWHSIIFGI